MAKPESRKWFVAWICSAPLPGRCTYRNCSGFPTRLLAPDGRRLSKRDKDLDLGELRKRMKAEQLLGSLAHAAGIIDQNTAVSAKELAKEFSWDKITGDSIYLSL